MIGIDIIEIKRFREIKKDQFSHWKKIFLPEEWEYSFKDSGSARHLAGTFAAKEAVIKALGGTYSEKPDKIFIYHDSKGRPGVKLLGSMKNVRIGISISHNKESAIAAAVLK